MDLWKAFNTMNHGLLLVKLKANTFTKDALKLMCSHLKNRHNGKEHSDA